MSYKLVTPLITGDPISTVIRKADNTYIPFDSGNIDYQEYLEWVSKGNTAEAAD